MELVYAYIDKYRTFRKQEILFSKKFEIKYNKEKASLRIKENPNYFNIYPQNIVNINGILGKNATGKTSLLHLIANSTYAYQRNKIRNNPSIYIMKHMYYFFSTCIFRVMCMNNYFLISVYFCI